MNNILVNSKIKGWISHVGMEKITTEVVDFARDSLIIGENKETNRKRSLLHFYRFLFFVCNLSLKNYANYRFWCKEIKKFENDFSNLAILVLVLLQSF
ncbi:hypothetical protein G9298_28865 (plasmid) [Bacillus thuringiensis]|nr:hypothetical protein G9298_28865 [Bacillus thuringiensis]